MSNVNKKIIKSDKIQVKGILFDLDGTILDTREAYVAAATAAFTAIGEPKPTLSVVLEIPKRMEQRLPLTEIVNGKTEAFLESYLKTFYEISASKTKPFPNVAQTLLKLSIKAKMALITMRFMPGKAVRDELKQFQLDTFFTDVVTALDTYKPKPSPEALIKASSAINVQMCDCIIVGDSVIDVEAGKAAGAKTVSVLSGLYSRAELQGVKPDYTIDTIEDLSEIIA
jgi:HAD superfamily hydrolase (TIGR01509 family)